MMRLAMVGLLLVGTVAFCQEKNPFEELHFDKVIMYDYVGGKDLPLINERGELALSVKKKEQLSIDEVAQLGKKLGEKLSFGRDTAACFDSALGVVYYEGSKVVAWLEYVFLATGYAQAKYYRRNNKEKLVKEKMPIIF